MWLPDWKHNSEVSKQSCLIWIFCFFCCFPSNCLKRTFFILEGICTLCNKILKSCSILLQSFSLLGVMSNGKMISLKEKPLSFIHQKVVILTLCISEDFCSSESAPGSGTVTAAPGLAGLWLTEFSQLCCAAVQCPDSNLCLASAFNWLSCNCSVRVSNKWIVYLLAYIEQCGGGGSDDIITDIISWRLIRCQAVLSALYAQF